MGIVILIVFAAVGFFVVKYLRDNRMPNVDVVTETRIRQEENDVNKVIYDAVLNLGASVEERAKQINRIFDDKSANLEWVLAKGQRDYQSKTQEYFYRIFKFSRNLSAMPAREREFLRLTYLLFSDGKINKEEFRIFSFSFLYNEGKAADVVIETRGLANVPSRGTLDYFYKFGDDDVIEKYCKDNNATPEKSINALLKKVESLPDGDSAKIMVNRRLRGGSVWLGEMDVVNSIFHANGQYKLRVGSLYESEQVLNYSGEGSLITIAPPGSGKTQCFVLPNMLSWSGAAFVLDIKGEIYSATHQWRTQNVGPVFKFSPLDPSNSHSYNPLVFIRQDSDFIWEDSRFLADMMIVPSGSSDPFWENMARDVVTAAIAYVTMHNAPDDRPMSKLLDLVYGIDWDEMVMALKTNVVVSAMRQTGYALSEMEKKTRDSVLKTAQSSLSAWQGERISRVTRKSDWSPLDLRTGKPTIYICINPNEIDSYLSVLRVIIAQHIRMLTSELPPRDTAPALFMLDELPRLKKMLPVEEALNIGRQYGLRLWMFAQSYGQLKEAYSNPEGILGSCTVRTFMNVPLSDELATKLSDQLGYREGPLDSSRQKLVEPLELAGPEFRDIILVLGTNTKPAKVRKTFAWQDEELKQRMTH